MTDAAPGSRLRESYRSQEHQQPQLAMLLGLMPYHNGQARSHHFAYPRVSRHKSQLYRARGRASATTTRCSYADCYLIDTSHSSHTNASSARSRSSVLKISRNTSRLTLTNPSSSIHPSRAVLALGHQMDTKMLAMAGVSPTIHRAIQAQFTHKLSQRMAPITIVQVIWATPTAMDRLLTTVEMAFLPRILEHIPTMSPRHQATIMAALQNRASERTTT